MFDNLEMSDDLVVKYAPKSFEELMLPQRLDKLIREQIEKKHFKLMLHGTAGTGKTTTARLITQGFDVLYLSGSNEFTAQLMRDKVYPWFSGHSITGKRKALIIDEAENMQNKIQDAFKVLLERGVNTSVIFITNEIQGMNEALRSRCTQIEYNFQQSEIEEQRKNYVGFALKVLQAENIQYDNSGVSALYKLFFPDFRHLLVVLQQFIDSGKAVTAENVNMLTENGVANIELYEALEIVDAEKFYQAISKFKGKERDCLISLGEPFFAWLNKKGKFETTIKCATVVSMHSNHFITSMNKFTTFFACCSELKSIIK